MEPAPTVDWIALNLLPGLGPISVRRAIDRYGDPAEIAYRLPIDEILKAVEPEHRMQSLIQAVVASPPFQMK